MRGEIICNKFVAPCCNFSYLLLSDSNSFSIQQRTMIAIQLVQWLVVAAYVVAKDAPTRVSI
jgi:hypothetical protein